jgi:hypothetical protein
VSQNGGLGIREFDLADSVLFAGDEVVVTLTVSNTDVIPKERTFDLSLDGRSVDSRRVFLDSGEERTFDLRGRVRSPGEHEVSVGRFAETVVVEGADDPESQSTTTAAGGTTPRTTTSPTTTARTTDAGLVEEDDTAAAAGGASARTGDGTLPFPTEVVATVGGLGSAVAYLLYRNAGEDRNE